MNKAKAYRELKRRQGRLSGLWSEVCLSGPHLYSEAERNNTLSRAISVQHIKHFGQPLRISILSRDDSDIASHYNSVLPDVRIRSSVSSTDGGRGSRNVRIMSKTLQTPMQLKRRQTPSVASDSSDRIGSSFTARNPRKRLDLALDLGGPQEITRQVIQYPLASRMRKVLSTDDSKPKHVNNSKDNPKYDSGIRDSTSSYSGAKSVVNNRNCLPIKSQTAITSVPDKTIHKPPTGKALLGKQVSFVHFPANDLSLADSQQNAPSKSEGPLLLTIKNLDMYNSLSRDSNAQQPAQRDGRVLSWIKERQSLAPQYHDIPEVEEELELTARIGSDGKSENDVH